MHTNSRDMVRHPLQVSEHLRFVLQRVWEIDFIPNMQKHPAVSSMCAICRSKVCKRKLREELLHMLESPSGHSGR
jgi:hypothetical protein